MWPVSPRKGSPPCWGRDMTALAATVVKAISIADDGRWLVDAWGELLLVVGGRNRFQAVVADEFALSRKGGESPFTGTR